MPRALVTWGGWDGHQPERVATLFSSWLRSAGVEVELFDTLSCFDDPARVAGFDLIVPVWTMSEIAKDQALNVCAAVAAGAGIAGCHGGMCDAFRTNVDWQFMTGAQWVAHPGNDGVDYKVRITTDHEVVAGLPDFAVKTEQYYLHIDPAVRIHAVCDFPVVDGPHAVNGPVEMPVVFTKGYGKGRVYYNALGHQANVIDHGTPSEMLKRGMLWAMRK